MEILAFDVSKDVLELFDGTSARQIANQAGDIEKLLKSHRDAVVVCEPTGRYHAKLVKVAVGLGLTVYVVNPREARNYKDSLSFRAKTDRLDAKYLHEYVKRNADLLRPHKPVDEQLAELRELIGKRHAVVEARTSTTQALGKRLGEAEKRLLKSFAETILELERQMESMARRYTSFKTLIGIPGVGLISGCALLYVLESRSFESADAVVAFLGLDVRVRQSGKYRGLEKVSKRGDPLLRFLACMAGRGLLNAKIGRQKRIDLKSKGREYAERLVIAARKLIRTAYTLFTQGAKFDPEKWHWA